MKVLLTGAAGQLGQALKASAPRGLDLVTTSRQELDLADPEACRSAVQQHQPDWVLNAGAYTAVDKAESESDLARRECRSPRSLCPSPEATGTAAPDQHRLRFQRNPGTPYQPEARDPSGLAPAKQLVSRYPKPARNSGTGADPAHQLGDRPRRQELRSDHAAAAPRTGSAGRCCRSGGLSHEHPDPGSACWRTLEGW